MRIELIMLPLRLLLLPFVFLQVATAEPKLPLVINTWAFVDANKAAWRKLQQHTALQALVEGCTTCERLQCDRTVGFGGSPDESGETTLDAMIMDGANMNMGAVAGLRGIKDASKVARHVLENTQHSLLVGEAASNFAEMLGFPRETLTTTESKAMWKEWRDKQCQPNFWLNVKPDARHSCGPYKPMHTNSRESGSKHAFGSSNHDTIGMIVIDSNAHIMAGTSSNGAKHKIPGRVGDSPIPGAGAYADNEVGAAVATGDGDIMMRFAPSFLAVEAMRKGETPAKAAQAAMQRILRFYPNFSGALVAADRFGNYGAACAGMQDFPYTIAHGTAEAESRIEHVNCLSIKKEAK